MKAIRIRAVGDNLIHSQLYKAAETSPGVYDFAGLFDPIEGLIREADIAIINQETPLVEDPSEVSSFPFFGTPKEISDAIVDAGFNVVMQASNHSLDKGFKGLETVRRIWKERHPETLVLGIHGSFEEQRRVPIVEVEGAKIALLNFTERLNLHPVPPHKSYALDIMKPYAKGKVLRQMKRARAEADYVIALPHWGGEYLPEPSPSQRKWAQFLADAGADLIIGGHAHVLQPLEAVTAQDGRVAPCFYSLGNLISCQVQQSTMVGGMADVLLEVDDEGRVSLASLDLVPLVTHTDEDYSEFSVYPLADYTPELLETNKILRVVSERFGRPVDLPYLYEVWGRSQEGRSVDDYAFSSHWDVVRGNIRGLISIVRHKNTKG